MSLAAEPRTAVIVDAVRTASGRRNGSLSGWHPTDLLASVLGALARRNDLDPAAVDEVIVGCATQTGAQGANVGRNAVLAAGWPESVPATTVDRQCGSSLQALHLAVHGVVAGGYDIAIAAGVEVMSLVPMGATLLPGLGQPFGPAMLRRYDDRGGLVPQAIAAEAIAADAGLGRAELDEWALGSHRRAVAARAAGRFAHEVVPVEARRRDPDTGAVVAAGPFGEDETIAEVTAGSLAALQPAFLTDGVVTAANSAPIADGAAAALITTAARARELGLTSSARVRALASVGSDPVRMLTGAVPATRRVLARAGLDLGAIDVVELSEPFASVALAAIRELALDPERVNVNGGAIALGHPLGASGARHVATLLAELRRRGSGTGLVAMGEAGGTASALVVDRTG